MGFIPLMFLLGMFIFAFVSVSSPLLYNPQKQLRIEAYENGRTIFTTYFYWYKSNPAQPQNSPHVIDIWNQDIIDKVANAQFPTCWEGPTDPEDMYDINYYHDALSHHPPAEQPEFDAEGNIVGELKTGVMSDISDWFSWTNKSWHQWELRCMMRAGIDVLMPVYWYNGIHNEWADEGLEYLVEAWHEFAQILVDEADAREPLVTHTLDWAKSQLPKIAMFFDTTCMKQLYCYNRSVCCGADFSECFNHQPGADLMDPYWMDQFWKCIEYFYDDVDDESAYDFNGNRVVWLYGNGWFGNVGTEVFKYCRQKFYEKYGLGLVFVGPHGWMEAGVDGVCDWGACCPGPVLPKINGIATAGIGPGYYNLGALSCQPPICHPRTIDNYKANWQRIMDQGAAWVHIETWNEYHEGTDISWTQEAGFSWIDATREMADTFHAMSGYDVFQGVNLAELIIPLIGFVGLLSIGILFIKNQK